MPVKKKTTRVNKPAIEVEEVKETQAAVVVEEEGEVTGDSLEENELRADKLQVTDEPNLGVANSEVMGQNTPAMEPETPQFDEKTDVRRPEANDMWSPDNMDSSNKKSGGRGLLVWVILLLLVGALAGGGYYWYQHHQAEGLNGEDSTAADQITQEATPTPTPTVSVVRSDWTIDVLNGTATSGVAKKVADSLKSLGYNIGKVGNAPSKDFTTSQLHVGSSDQTKAQGLLSDFKTYGVSEIKADLTKAASMSAQLIIGANYSGASSTASPTPTSGE